MKFRPEVNEMTESMARPIVAAQRAIFIFSCMMELVPEKLMCVYVLYVGPVFSYFIMYIHAQSSRGDRDF